MLQLWGMSKTWRCRPSEILRLTDEIAAYCLDRAVYLFGTAYDADINDAAMPPPGSKGKHNASQMIAMTNARWMKDNVAAEKDDSDFEVVVDAKYRDPAVRFGRG
jgi:hypothetical protein